MNKQEDLQELFEDDEPVITELSKTEFDETRYRERLKAVATSVNNNDELEERLKATYEANKKHKSLNSVREDFYDVLRQLIHERVKEIKDIIGDPIKRGIRETQLNDWLDIFFSRKIREEVVNEILSSDLKPKIYNLRETLDMKKNNELYHVSELFRYGSLLLLTASPKTGKSLFATNLIRASITGDLFLGRQTKKANVLYIQNEEAPEDTGQKLESNGLQLLKLKNPELYENLLSSDNFYLAKGLDIIVDIGIIIHYIEHYNIKVIAIDSLGASVTKKGFTEMNTEVMVALYDLQKVVQYHNVFCIVTHHKNKAATGKGHDDALKQVAGFNGIVRANDGLITMSKSAEEGEEGLINVDFIPRSDEPHSMKLRRVEGEALFWDFQVEEESSLSAENINSQNQILRALLEKYQEWLDKKEHAENNSEPIPPVEGLSLNKINKLLNMDDKFVLSRVNYMLRTNAIEMRTMRINGENVYIYHYPKSGESWLQKYLDEEDEQIEREAELDNLDRQKIDEFMNCRTKEQIKDAMSSCNLSDLRRLNSKFTETEYQHFWQTLYPPLFEVGTWVKIAEIDEIDQIRKIEYPKAKSEDKTSCHKYFLSEEKFGNQEFRQFQLEQALNVSLDNPETEN